MMRRTLIIVVTAAAAALGGVWAASVVAPCALPLALMDKIAPGKAAACPAPAQAAADQPRAVEPPAVTIVPAVKREFVDRLFVSGTLVAREEAQVAARIDGLAIVELDAEDGDRVKARAGSGPPRSHPTRCADGAERRGDQARRCGDRSGGKPDRAVSGASAIRERRFRPRAQARRGDHGRFDHRAARDGDEDGAGPIGRRPVCARPRRGRPQEPRRGAAGAHGAYQSHGGESARGRDRQPPVGQARCLRFDFRRAAVSHHRGRSGRSRGRRARADARPPRRRHAGGTEAAGRRGRGLRPRPPREPGGRQGEPHRQGPDRAWRRFARPYRRLRLRIGRTRPSRGRWRSGDRIGAGWR